jgi:branched-chain amino acid transport system substrate-binding protein
MASSTSRALALVLGCAAAAGCWTPDPGATNFTCSSDSDCLRGFVCATINEKPACVSPVNAPINVGLSAPLQGPSQDLGVEMRRGILAHFSAVNREGGVRGRQLNLVAMNDGYDPTAAVANVKRLLDIQMEVPNADSPDVRGPNSVLALLGNVGTPTMLATAPLANKNGVVFFAPFTGSQKYLRDGTDSPFVFNYRAGYYEETEAMVDFMASYRTPRIITGTDSYKNLLAFTQNDSYGDAGYDGLVTAYNVRVAPIPQPDSSAPSPSIARVTYEREDVASVDPAIARAEQFLSGFLGAGAAAKVAVGIVMIDTYQPGNKFIRAIKDWLNADPGRAGRLDVLFIHVSFVGSDALGHALTSAPDTYLDATDPAGQRRKSYADGVMITQVVPYYRSQAPGITDYRADMARLDGGLGSFTSLEGYIAARLFVEGLKADRSPLGGSSLIDTFNRMSSVDIGIGTLLGFSSTNHQASHTVWGSRLAADGTFTVPFVWDPMHRIVPGSN